MMGMDILEYFIFALYILLTSSIAYHDRIDIQSAKTYAYLPDSYFLIDCYGL